MKKYIFFLSLLFIIHVETKAQHEKQFTAANYFTALKSTVLLGDNTFSKTMYSSVNNGPDKDRDFYLRRSKNYRIVGWSTLGGGLLLGVSAILVSSNNSSPDYETVERTDRTITTLFILSAATGIVSIPFMIMASVYKHKARVMLKNQPTGFGVPPNVNKNITGISMIFPLGK